MKNVLGLVILVGALVTTPLLAGAAPHVSITRCRGTVMTKVVHPHGHARTIGVCVPATKRLDATIGLGAAPSSFKVAFTYVTTTPGPVAQFYDTATGNVLSLYVSRSVLLAGFGDAAAGIGGPSTGADGKIHRAVVTVGSTGSATYQVDGRSIELSNAWSGALPSTLHVSIGGWSINQNHVFAGNVGTVYTGTASHLLVTPGS